MVVKWKLPPGKPPAWLDPALEVQTEDPKDPPGVAIAHVVDTLRRLGCSLDQAFGVTANLINESAWFQKYRGNNPSGWKITKQFAEGYQKRTGRPAKWWRAPGNITSLDPPWVYYRAFDTMEEFLCEWLAHFCPRPGIECPYPGYKTCGAQFWRGEQWFGSLCAAGYKGPVTQARPAKSIEEHQSLVRSARTRWAQATLGVDPDGEWGPKSQAACAAVQRAHQLPATGLLNDETLQAIANEHVPVG